jgi:hypothetical protein
MCDGCFSRSDKKTPKLSSTDTTVTMTPAAQESFKQRRKFKDVKKNAKRWSKKGGASSSSDPPPAKKAKSAAVHMIITSDALDDNSTEHPSKTSFASISVARSGSFASCSFRHRLSGR